MKGHCIGLVALLVLSGGIAMATPTEVDWTSQNKTRADLDVGFHEIIGEVGFHDVIVNVEILVDHDTNIVDVDLFQVPVFGETVHLFAGDMFGRSGSAHNSSTNLPLIETTTPVELEVQLMAADMFGMNKSVHGSETAWVIDLEPAPVCADQIHFNKVAATMYGMSRSMHESEMALIVDLEPASVLVSWIVDLEPMRADSSSLVIS